LYITLREREIINLLLLHPNGITISDIALKLGLSQRTIHRELKHIAIILTKHEIRLEKKAGVGLFLLGKNEKRSELKISLLKQTSDFTSKEREELILLDLLKSTDVTKLVAFANDFNVTVGTISRDLDKIALYLKYFDIELVRKKGQGISLEATEQKKRNALGYFLASQFNEYEFLEILKDPVENKNRFLEIIKIEKLTLSDKLIREMMEQHDLQLTDHAHMTLTIHLSLAIQRIVQGEIITIDESLLDELKNDDKYTISKGIVEVIEDVFNIKIPDAELGYITIHLKGARLNAPARNHIGKHISIYTSVCKSLISYVSQKLDVPFEKDSEILEGLLKHIEPAIYRLERGLNLYNPLTSKIITEYPRLFGATKKGLEKYFNYLLFSDSEIAYIVLYFGSSSILYDVKRGVKLAVICPSGLGSSKMLAHRIEKEIEGVNSVTTFSLGDLNSLDLSDFDVILSTIEITGYPSKYLLISPILSEAEIDYIQKEIKQYSSLTEEILLKRVHQRDKSKEMQHNFKNNFYKAKIYSELVLKLLDEFDINYIRINGALDEVISEILRIMYVNKLIINIEGVRDDLKKRESLGGFGIPETQVAFYHCRTTHVHEPVFNLFRLNKAIRVVAMDKTMIDVTNILVLLAPMEASEIKLKVLSLISVAVIDDVSETKLFSIGSKSSIEERLGNVFYDNFRIMFKSEVF